jgi:hypothetical protein
LIGWVTTWAPASAGSRAGRVARAVVDHHDLAMRPHGGDDIADPRRLIEGRNDEP